MLFLQIAIIIAAFVMEAGWAQYLTLAIPILYAMIMAPGTFSGGGEVDEQQLRDTLKERWRSPDELARYMKKHWFGLKYVATGFKRQSNAFGLAVISSGLAVYNFSQADWVLFSIHSVCAVLLFYMAVRSNRPLSTIRDRRMKEARNEKMIEEVRLAAAALVAFSELFPDSRDHQQIADEVREDICLSRFLVDQKK